MKYAEHPKRDSPAGRAGFEIDVLVIDSNPLPRSRIGLPMCFHHQCKTKHLGGRCSSELGRRGQPDTATQVTTNVSSRFSVVRVISDARVIRGYSRVDVWNVPEVLAQEHFFGHILTKFHYLFSDVTEKCVAGPATNQHDHSPRYIAMAAPDLIKCVPTLFLLNPSLASPIAPTASCNASIMWSDVTWLIILWLKYVETGEFAVVPWYFRILFTIAAAALTGQRILSPDAIWVMVSIFSSFFCRSKVTGTHSANSSSGWSWSSCSDPRKKWMLRSLTISVHCCSDWWTLRYSHDCMAKKMASVPSGAVALLSSELHRLLISETTEIGMAAWWFSGGSLFLKDLNSRCKMNASWPSSSRVGLGCPCSRKVAERYWMVPRTVFAANCP
jgi:hypothetical protein